MGENLSGVLELCDFFRQHDRLIRSHGPAEMGNDRAFLARREDLQHGGLAAIAQDLHFLTHPADKLEVGISLPVLQFDHSAWLDCPRIALGMRNQAEFAKALGIPQTTVSAWKKQNTPSAEAFFRLGALAPEAPDSLFFWEKAGLTRQSILSAADKILEGRKVRTKEEELIQIESFAGDREPRVVLPKSQLANPGSTCFLVVDDEYSGYLLDAGDIIILERNLGDKGKPAPFFDQTVLATLLPSLGGELSAFWPQGLIVGKLRLRSLRRSREGKEERNAAIRAAVAQVGRPNMRSWVRNMDLIISSIREGIEGAEVNSWTAELEPLNYQPAGPLLVGYHNIPEDSKDQINERAERKDRKVQGSAKGEIRVRARNEMRLMEGASILGRIIAWFDPSSGHLREVPDEPSEGQQ